MPSSSDLGATKTASTKTYNVINKGPFFAAQLRNRGFKAGSEYLSAYGK